MLSRPQRGIHIEMIIGLTGPNACGKGEVAKYLSTKGYRVYSLSDVLRTEAEKVGLDLSRQNLINFGRKLRKKYGKAVLVKKLLSQIQKHKNVVIDSIRNTGEISELRKLSTLNSQLSTVFILGVDAPAKLRYQRLCQRKRLGDTKTFTEFMETEKKENSSNKFNQQISHCMKLADKVIINDSSLKQLHKRIDSFLSAIENSRLPLTTHYSPVPRPSWDKYFLKLALLVAERSTCRRHHVGAVIVRDKRLLTTGYNGAPAGVKDCLELGCLREELGIPSGTRQEICRAIHAEQNAIIQAGLYGINIEGATIYCTHTPCTLCARMLANAKIKRYVTCGTYADKSFCSLFNEAKIKFAKLKKPNLKIGILD